MSGKRFWESEAKYIARTEHEASERVIESETGTSPSRNVFEGSKDYRDRVKQEAAEHVVNSETGSRPHRQLFERDDKYQQRVVAEADEIIIETEKGAKPSKGIFENSSAYAGRIRREARKAQADETKYRERRHSGHHSRNPSARYENVEPEFLERLFSYSPQISVFQVFKLGFWGFWIAPGVGFFFWALFMGKIRIFQAFVGGVFWGAAGPVFWLTGNESELMCTNRALHLCYDVERWSVLVGFATWIVLFIIDRQLAYGSGPKTKFIRKNWGWGILVMFVLSILP